MEKKKIWKTFGIVSCFVLFFVGIFVLSIVLNRTKYTTTALAYDATKRIYLSDIDYLKDSSYVENGYYIRMDKNNDSKLISVNVDGKTKPFIKGISAWATSNLVYDLRELDYDYFTAYLGVDASRTETYYNGGVIFTIYTSMDGETWNQAFKTGILKGWDDAVFAKVNIQDVNYLRLYAYENGDSWYSHWYDDAVYADAKLVTEDYEENNVTSGIVQPVGYYDQLIREGDTNPDSSKDYQLFLLQREFVQNVGYDVLQAYLSYSEEYRTTISWLMSHKEILEEFLLGGTPDGSYGTAITILSQLYEKYKNDLNDPTYGKLYLKMMISLSLTHSANVGLWVTGAPDNPDDTNGSNAINRYAIYKKLHQDGLLKKEIFENISVEEMRFVMNNIIDDEEIMWLNNFATINKSTDPYKYVTYRSGYDYYKEQYYNLSRMNEWNQKIRKELNPNPYSFLTPYTDANGKVYTIQYGIANRPKLWVVFEEGGVCGAISKTGSNLIGSYGVPSTVVSQPGHAAYIYMNLDQNGKKIWTLYNDVSGWGQTGKTEKLSVRMPNGWGTGSYVGSFPGSYILLAQAALNDYDNYANAEKIMMKAGTYQNDTTKLKEIYENAIQVQNINFDAWLGLVNTYLNDSHTTEEELLKLAQRITTDLRYYPLPMHDLMRLMDSKFTGGNHAIYLNLIHTALTAASKATDQDVLQARPTQQVANYLLQNHDTKIATFSFDGENANQIILADRYVGNGVVWEYSLDGGENWIRVNENSTKLTEEQLKLVNAENDILIRIVGAMESIYDIDITESNVPPIVYNNDLENKVIGANETMEWRLQENKNWTSFQTQEPDLSGNKTVYVRTGYTGTKLASKEVVLKFTKDSDDKTQKYVSNSRISVDDFSTDEPSQNNAVKNAIDGNINTIWHTKWDGSDTEKYIILKVDTPIYLTKLQYLPRQDANNGKITKADVLISMDGETWEVVAENIIWDTSKNMKELVLEEGKQAQYIKLVGKETYGSYASAAMINLFEDSTKIKEVEPTPSGSTVPSEEPTPAPSVTPSPSEYPTPTPNEKPEATPAEKKQPEITEKPIPAPNNTKAPSETVKPSQTPASTSSTSETDEITSTEKEEKKKESQEEQKEEQEHQEEQKENTKSSQEDENSWFDQNKVKIAVITILSVAACVIIIL